MRKTVETVKVRIIIWIVFKIFESSHLKKKHAMGSNARNVRRAAGEYSNDRTEVKEWGRALNKCTSRSRLHVVKDPLSWYDVSLPCVDENR